MNQDETVPLSRALDELDLEDADAVATLLRRRGITGAPCRAQRCPLSRYLTERTERVISVTDTLARYADREKYAPLPPAAITFINRFDSGDYPELRATQEEQA